MGRRPTPAQVAATIALGAAHRHAGLAASKTAAPATFAGDNAGAPPRPLTVVSDDRWDRHATGDATSGFKTNFQRSLEGAGPDFERKSALASHRESARVIVQTMERIGCHS